MALTDMMGNPQQRLVAREGMVVDVSTWNASHDYHALHRLRHNVSLHRPGVIAGLEVVAWDPPDNSVVINPGVAVDSEGHTVIVGEPQRFQLQTGDAGLLYLILQYREVPSGNGGSSANGNAGAGYLLEAYRIEERRDLPDGPFVELCRIQVSGGGAVVSDAADQDSPRPDEVDLRFRAAAGPLTAETIKVGIVPLEMTAEGQVLHFSGLMALLKAINTTTPYLGEYIGSVNLSQEIAECHLLVVAGRQSFTLAPEWVLVVKSFLDRGGVLLGEACGVGDNGGDDFRQSFLQLAERLEVEMTTIERGDRLLKSHHLFSQPPDGADGPALVATGVATGTATSGNLIYTNADYGCLWDGGRPDAPATRDTIRSATEFGVNMCVFASESVRRQSIRMVAQ